MDDVRRKSDLSFQEQILCVLKLHKSGLLDVSPGFSKYEGIDSKKRSGVFFSSIDLVERKGFDLSTFLITTKQGVLYQYTLEWPDLIKDFKTLEKKEKEQVDEDFQKISRRRIEVIKKLKKVSPLVTTWNRKEDAFLLEFVSAEKFCIKPSPNLDYSHVCLFIRYEILPGNWTPLCSTDMREVKRNKTLLGTTKKVTSLNLRSLSFATDPISLMLIFIVFKMVRIKTSSDAGS